MRGEPGVAPDACGAGMPLALCPTFFLERLDLNNPLFSPRNAGCVFNLVWGRERIAFRFWLGKTLERTCSDRVRVCVCVRLGHDAAPL